MGTWSLWGLVGAVIDVCGFSHGRRAVLVSLAADPHPTGWFLRLTNNLPTYVMKVHASRNKAECGLMDAIS